MVLAHGCLISVAIRKFGQGSVHVPFKTTVLMTHLLQLGSETFYHLPVVPSGDQVFNTESSRALLELKHNSPSVLPGTLSPFICVFLPGGTECSPQGGPAGKEGEYVNYTKGLTLGPPAQRLIKFGPRYPHI